MAINIRRVGEVADGSVTASKLATGAVDLGTDKVTGQAPSTKIADSAITEAKLNDLAVSTAKIANAAITLAKASDDVALSHFAGDETEVSVTGITETLVKEFNFAKVDGKYSPTKIRVLSSLKTSNASHQATLKIYFDGGATAIVTLNSISESYELLSAEADVSALAAGRHTCEIKLVSADAAETAYNDYIDINWIKG